MLHQDSKTVEKESACTKPEREFLFTDLDFRSIRELLLQRTGIYLAESKRDLAYGRLARIVRKRGLERVKDYLDIVREGEGDVETEFTNALTTNVTSFFREPAQFEFLKKDYIPELLEKNRSSKKIRFWSSACSTGQEPYSIAIVLIESTPRGLGWSARILATDLDSNVLETARQGVYTDRCVENMSSARQHTWFERGKGEHAGQVRVRPALQDAINFKQLNLMDAWPIRGPLDAIFCRNVVIYFTKDTQRRLFNRMADLLGEGRCLFLGHSESLMGVTDRFEFCGNNTYRKIK